MPKDKTQLAAQLAETQELLDIQEKELKANANRIEILEDRIDDAMSCIRDLMERLDREPYVEDRQIKAQLQRAWELLRG